MIKKLAKGASALAFVAALCSCSAEEARSEKPDAEETPAVEVEAPTEDSDEVDSDDSAGGYQVIYDEYSARLQNECPNLAMTECAELANEGVREMAKYMYTAKGKEGQYATYEEWSQSYTTFTRRQLSSNRAR